MDLLLAVAVAPGSAERSHVYVLSVGVDGNGLCPAATYPVPVGTPLISPLLQWDHAQTWDVPKAEDFSGGSAGPNSATVYNIGEEETLAGDSRPFVPPCRINSFHLSHRNEPRVLRLLPDWPLHRWACPVSGDGLPGAGLAHLGEESGGGHGQHAHSL